MVQGLYITFNLDRQTDTVLLITGPCVTQHPLIAAISRKVLKAERCSHLLDYVLSMTNSCYRQNNKSVFIVFETMFDGRSVMGRMEV